MSTTKKLQSFLGYLGYQLGSVDGIFGPRTRQALRAFQVDHDLIVDGVPGPMTWLALSEKVGERSPSSITPPWVEELQRRIGLHEKRDHEELSEWLKSAGSYVDPEDTPWCGDAMETAILRTLPEEPVPDNPMASYNWLKFGRPLQEPVLGAIMVFWRGDPNGRLGHVAVYMGEDEDYYHVLGGNQSNQIRTSRYKKSQLRPNGVRWPKSYPLPG